MKRKITLTLGLFILLAISGVALAQLNPETWRIHNDFSDGNIPNEWGGTNDITTVSYDGDYSMDVSGTSRTDPLLFNDGVEQFYMRMQQPSFSVNGNSYEQAILAIDGEVGLLWHMNSDWCGRGFVVADTTGTIQRTDKCPANFNTWYDIYMVMNQTDNTGKVFIWETGTPMPNSPQWSGSIDLSGIDENRLKMQGGFEGFASWYMDSVSWGEALPSISGTVTNIRREPLDNVTITVSQSGSVVTSTQTFGGDYSVGVQNGTYNISATKSGWINQTKSVNISGDTNIDFTLRNKTGAFDFRVNNWMKHGTTQKYTALYDDGYSIEVITSETNVTTDNNTVLSIDNTANTISATSDKSINNRVNITAIYERNGNNFTIQQQITVANRTMENIEIMPPSQYIPAALGFGEDGTVFGIGSEIQWVLLAIFIGAGAAWIARNEWVGIGLIVALNTFFWVLGNVSLGITMVAVFYGLFAGYQLNKIPGRSDTNVNPSNDVQPPEPPQQ